LSIGWKNLFRGTIWADPPSQKIVLATLSKPDPVQSLTNRKVQQSDFCPMRNKLADLYLETSHQDRALLAVSKTPRASYLLFVRYPGELAALALGEAYRLHVTRSR